jgi:ADP-ribosylglycohydrolase
MLRESARISAMTHWDAQAEVCCAVYCLWVQRLLNAESRHDAWQAAIDDAREVTALGTLAPNETPGPFPLPTDFWSRLEHASRLPESKLQPTGYAGYVLDCLEAAVWWVVNSDTLEDTLIGCVNMAGEADTIAAVAGGAAGACWGLSAIPSRWQQQLLERERIINVGQQLTELRGKSESSQ